MNRVKGVVAFLWQIPASILVLIVRFYQRFLSPLKGPTCRFTPTCSHYFIESVKKYGAVRGTVKGVVRICKCHPFHPGGTDLP